MYYIDDGITGPSTIYITGTTVFNNAVVAIAPNKTLKVIHGQNLVISHSHLYCCRPDSMWAGIVLEYLSGSQAAMRTESQTLIEDAVTAVTINTNVLADGMSMIFSSNNTVYNRNQTGVSITHEMGN